MELTGKRHGPIVRHSASPRPPAVTFHMISNGRSPVPDATQNTEAGSGTPHIVISGAGVCGLYAARTLVAHGLRVTVLEKEEMVGGLAAGHLRAGNYYDLGVHHLHAFDQAIFEDIRAIMGERLIPSEKVALIRYGSGYRRYPLEFMDLLTGIPPWTLLRALVGMTWQQLLNKRLRTEPANAEEALIRLYGKPLYGFFFRDFTHRYWGFPPTELSAAFVRSKMPRLSAVDFVKKALGRLGMKEEAGETVEGAMSRETLWYSPTGSREMPMALADFVRAHGGQVLTEAQLTAVETDGGRVLAVRHALPGGGEARIECDALINTVPLQLFVKAFDPPPPPPVLEAAGRLRYRPMVVYGLLVRRERVLNALFVYFRNRIFHRIAEPSGSGMEVRPAGHTVLLCEVMCEIGDDRWLGGEASRRSLFADLAAENLVREEDVVEVHLIHSYHAYPVFALGFEPNVEALQSFIAPFGNLLSTGRQGGFCFPNMHGAMRMGADAAEAIAHRLRPQLGTAPVAAALVGSEEAGTYLPGGDMPTEFEPAGSAT